jgi:hypothetical protein
MLFLFTNCKSYDRAWNYKFRRAEEQMPQNFVLQHCYTLQQKISVIQTGINEGNLHIPKFLQWLFKEDIQHGYKVNVFDYG